MILLEVTVLASGSEVEGRLGDPKALRGSGEPGTRQSMNETGLMHFVICFDLSHVHYAVCLNHKSLFE